MSKSKRMHDPVALPMLLAVLLHNATAQTPAPTRTDGRLPATVTITAPRPINLEGYRAAEARIKNILLHQPTLSSPFLGWCMENRFAQENDSSPGTPLPLVSQGVLNTRIRCGRAHIEAKDTTLRQGLEAFDKRDYAAALEFFRKAYSKMGTEDAALMLAKMHFDGLGTPKDKVQGIKWLRETAGVRFDPWRDRIRFNPGDPKAMNARIEAAMMLARIYEEGNGAARDWKQAESWYGKAAEFGFVPALEILGQAYLSGEGGDKNVPKALDCFKEAAQAGYSPAAYNLGKLYYLGRDGVAHDLRQAGAYFELAAKAGHTGALFAVGRMYELGEGLPADPEKAFVFYREAAMKGDADAEFALGTFFYHGKVIPQDRVVARELFVAAAAQGQPDAIRSLATMQSTQADVTKDPATLAEDRPVEAALNSVTTARNQQDHATVDGAHARQMPTMPDVPSDNPTSDTERAAPRNQVDTATASVVRVTALRAIPWKSYRAMRAAVAAYEKYKFLAPDALFSFAVLPPAGKALPPNFELRVRTKNGDEFPITLSNGKLFELPVLPDPDVDANLVSNLKEGPLRIGLLLHTRNVPPEKERLGDVRLRNEIGQAIADVDHPNDDPRCFRKGHGNSCKPQHGTVWYKPRAPASSARLVEGNRREPLETNGNPDYYSYKIPVGAGRLGNDAIIEFDYKNPLGSVKQTVVLIYDENDK